MRMKLLRNLCIRGAAYEAGDVVEVDATIAAYLMRRGVGVEEETTKVVTTSAPAPVVEVATLPAAEKAVGRRQRRSG